MSNLLFRVYQTQFATFLTFQSKIVCLFSDSRRFGLGGIIAAGAASINFRRLYSNSHFIVSVKDLC